MLRLEDREWKSFSIASVASISPGKRLTKADMLPGKMPFIGASDSCNGITEFTSNKNESEDSNVLGVNYDGSVVENFYHPYRAVFSDAVKRLHLLDHEGNQYIYLFLKTTILKQKSKYQYAYKFNEARLKRQRILLPATPSGDPDYAFMEAYGKQLIAMKISEYEDYARKALCEVEYKEVPKIEDMEWAAHYLIGKNMFSILPSSGVSTTSIDESLGSIDVVGATSRNNGNVAFANEKYKTNVVEKNKICLIKTGQGSVGDAVYKGNDFLPSNNVAIIEKNDLNRFFALFVVACINKCSDRYNYGYIRSDKRIKREKIMLPTMSNGRPDFDYMEQYAKNIYRKKIEEYLDYLGAVKASLQAQPQ